MLWLGWILIAALVIMGAVAVGLTIWEDKIDKDNHSR